MAEEQSCTLGTEPSSPALHLHKNKSRVYKMPLHVTARHEMFVKRMKNHQQNLTGQINIGGINNHQFFHSLLRDLLDKRRHKINLKF